MMRLKIDHLSFCKLLITAIFIMQGSALSAQCFSPSIQVPTGSQPNRKSVLTGDFNGDGFLDALAVNAGGAVQLFKGNGLGGFSPLNSQTIATGTSFGYSERADIDKDGDLDVLIPSNGNNAFYVLLNNGAGTFVAKSYPTGSNPISLTVADFNGDNKLDVVIANSGNNSLSLYFGDGAGNFGGVTTIPTNAPGISNPSFVLAQDFNVDGLIDIATTMTSGNKVLVLWGNAMGTYSVNTLNVDYSTYSVGNKPVWLSAADFNKDGKLDLAVVNNTSSTISILNGNVTSPYFILSGSYNTGVNPTSVAIGDFNQDNNLDLACANSADASVGIFNGNSTGGFALSNTYKCNPNAQPQSIAASDFNYDGNSDLITANTALNNADKGLSLFMNDPAPMIPSISVNQPNCISQTGSITIVVQKQGHTYSFDNGNSFQAANSLSNLDPGTYYVLIKNISGCVSPTNSVVINVPPAVPSLPIIAADHENCTIGFTIVKQNNDDTYSIDNVNFSTINSYSNLSPGNYNVTIKNNKGCTAINNIQLEPVEGAPSAPVISSIVQPTCNDPLAKVIIAQQNSSDTYSFDNGVSFQTENSKSNLDPGPYDLNLFIKNKDGCKSAPTTVSIKDFTPDLSVEVKKYALCNKDSTQLTLSNPNNVEGTQFIWSIDKEVNVGISKYLSTSGKISDQLELLTDNVNGSITYAIQARSGNCYSDTKSVTIQVGAVPVISIEQTSTICSGTAALISVTNSNQVPNTTINWSVTTLNVLEGNGGLENLPDDNLNPLNIVQTLRLSGVSPDKITYSIIPSATNDFVCNGKPSDIVITVNPIPVIDIVNEAPMLCSDNATSISILNTNKVPGASCEWTISNSTVTGGALGSGNLSMDDTNPLKIIQTLAVVNAPDKIEYSFTPIFTNGNFNCYGQSKSTSIVVNPIPKISINAPSALCSGDQTNITVINANNVTGAYCNWIINPTSVLGGSEGAGILSNTDASPLKIVQPLTVTNNISAITYKLTPYFINSNFTCTGQSSDVALTINPVPIIEVPDVIPPVCDGGNTYIELSNPNKVDGIKYQWSLSTNNLNVVNYSSSAGPIIDQLVLLDPNTVGAVTYTISAIAASCQSSQIKRTIQVNPVPDIQSNNLTPKICNGDQATIILASPTKNLPNITYKWKWGTVNSNVKASETNGITFSKITQKLELTDDLSGPGSLTYQITPITNSCIGPTITADVIVNPNPSLTIEPSFSLCSNIPFTFLGGKAGITFTWDILTNTNVTGIGGVHNGPELSEKLSSTDGKTVGTAIYQIRGISQDNCSSAPVYTVATVLPKPSFTVTNNEPIICSGQRVSLSFSTKIPGAQLLLTKLDYNGVSGGSIEVGKSRFVDGQKLDQLLLNNTTSPDTVFYEFQPVYNSCVGDTLKTYVIVRPQPKMEIDFDFDVLCNGATNILRFSSTNGTTAYLDKLVLNGLTRGNPSFKVGDSFGDGNSFKEILINPTNSDLVAEYTFTLKNGFCLGDAIVKQVKTLGKTTNLDLSFTESKVCNGDRTLFNPSILIQSGGTVSSMKWDFGDGISSLNPGNPVVHKFMKGPGTYNVSLEVKTNSECAGKFSKLIKISPVIDIPKIGFLDSLENDKGWTTKIFNTKSKDYSITIPDSTSWLRSVPNGKVIVSLKNTVWWTGNNYSSNGSTYGANENSVLISPCFKIDPLLLKRPMVSFQSIVDLQKNVDGVVFQYSFDGFTWENIGKIGEGVNWYNGAGITSNPGNQLIGNYGWTDNVGPTWKSSRYNLNQILTPTPINENIWRDTLQFRFAFASDKANPQSYDGFAFDNFFLGEKKRTVLVEQFENYSIPISIDYENYINQLFDSQVQLNGYADFNPISYHINYPGRDTLNLANPEEPSARAGFYGITSPPVSIMNGYIGTSFNPGSNPMIAIDTASLADTKFDLTLKATKGTTDTKLNIELLINANSDFNNPILAYIVLIDNSIGPFKNVVRKQLLGADGKLINQKWVTGQSLTITLTDMEVNKPVFNPNNLSLVAFVQDKITRKVYQSLLISCPPVKHKVITGTEISNNLPRDLTLFPNPAFDQLNFYYPLGANSWSIVNQLGIEILSGNIGISSNNISRIDIRGLSEGVYYFKLSVGEIDKPVIKKFVVLHY